MSAGRSLLPRRVNLKHRGGPTRLISSKRPPICAATASVGGHSDTIRAPEARDSALRRLYLESSWRRHSQNVFRTPFYRYKLFLKFYCTQVTSATTYVLNTGVWIVNHLAMFTWVNYFRHRQYHDLRMIAAFS